MQVIHPQKQIIITRDSLLWDLLKENNLTNCIGEAGGHLAITEKELGKVELAYAMTYLGNYTTDEVDEVDDFIDIVVEGFNKIKGGYIAYYLIQD